MEKKQFWCSFQFILAFVKWWVQIVSRIRLRAKNQNNWSICFLFAKRWNICMKQHEKIKKKGYKFGFKQTLCIYIVNNKTLLAVDICIKFLNFVGAKLFCFLIWLWWVPEKRYQKNTARMLFNVVIDNYVFFFFNIFK